MMAVAVWLETHIAKMRSHFLRSGSSAQIEMPPQSPTEPDVLKFICNCADFGDYIGTAIQHNLFHWHHDKPRFEDVVGSIDTGYESIVRCPECGQQWQRGTRSSGHAEIDTLTRI